MFDLNTDLQIEAIPFAPVADTLFTVTNRYGGRQIAIVSTEAHAWALLRGAMEWPMADFEVEAVEPTPDLVARKDIVPANLLNAAEGIYDVQLVGLTVAA